jgi:hypothetical protein
MTTALGLRVETERAIDWVRGSLARGSDLARLISARLSALSKALILVEPSRVQGPGPILDDSGRGIPSSEAYEVAKRILATAARTAKLTLVVEDDLARQGDPHLGRAAFVGARVLRWEEVDDQAKNAVTILRRGASGYPLNAYICQGRPADLGLSADLQLSPIQQQRLADSVLGVIVSVWDAEAFVAVVSPTLTV